MCYVLVETRPPQVDILKVTGDMVVGFRTPSSCPTILCAIHLFGDECSPGEKFTKWELRRSPMRVFWKAVFQLPPSYVGGDNPGGSNLSVCLWKAFVCKPPFCVHC